LRPRHIAAVALVLGLTVAGFILARANAERDARENSRQRVEIAAAQIRTRVAVATSLTESLRRFMLDEGATGVTTDEFARNALRWLSPADLPATAWAEEVRAADRAAYERRIGQPIVTPDERRTAVPPGSSYLPATLVSGFPPMNSRGVDLRRELGIPAALRRAIRPGGVGATPVATRRDGTRGLFLVAAAPNLIDGVLRPGAVVVFLSEATLRTAARNPAGLRFPPADRPSAQGGGEAVREEFTVAGQRFAVVMPEESVSGAGAALPWIILAGGLLLAALAGALGVIAARRARAQRDFDRIFNLSPDLVAVANFDGHFTRVNPAAEQILGYTEEELLTRPYLDLVHPDDRERTAAEAAAIGEGKRTLSFENRYARKDGSYRVLEWTSTPVVEEGAMYSVGRDVTERRKAETEAERLADEQAALRRVATVVARGGSRAEVFGAIAEEVRQLFRDSLIYMFRYEDERAVVAVASAGIEDVFPIGSRQELGGNNAATRVFRTGEPVRIDDYATAGGPIAEVVRPSNARSVVGTPIVVDEGLWGVMVVGTTEEDPLPPETERRLGQFTELMATAIANTEARVEVERLADEQAALRRVATLVAEDVPPSELFAAATEEAGKLLGADLAGMIRYNDDGTVSPIATWAAAGEHPPLPSSWPTQEGDAATMVAEAGGPVRVDRWTEVPGRMAALIRELGIHSSVGSPISVEGRLWGALAVHSQTDRALPVGTESRLVSFTELVATAMANAEARGEVERLAQEQAALRRVATLVAEGAQPAAIFDAVAGEMDALLDADQVALNRFEPGDQILVLAHRGLDVERTPVGSHLSIEGESATATVRRTGRPARMENYDEAQGAVAELARATGLHSSVSAPIVVEGRLWGLITASWKGEQSPPPDTEQRMSRFAQLLDTAIANADARAELVASRARLVAASDEARRRVERDLHDGVQQRLVLLALELRGAQALAPPDNAELAGELTRMGKGLAEALDDLRELSRGIHPAILSEGGLVPALKALARRSAVPVQLDLAIVKRLDERVEIGAYYVVSEALTNTAKHARASKVEVHARAFDGVLELKIDDDGVGGADPSIGSGLTGLADRVEALGGTISMKSPPGEGTSLRVELSLDSE
jgi:PAS domain S-box-containing protein